MRAGFLALFFHAQLKPFLIDSETVFFNDVCSKVGRETVGVVQFEQGGARNGFYIILAQHLDFVLQDTQAIVEGQNETLFLVADHFSDVVGTGNHVRVGFGHALKDKNGGVVQNRVFESEHLGVAHAPSHDSAQYIATPFVARQYSVGNQESGRPAVVGHDPHRDVIFNVVAVGLAGQFFDVGDDHSQKIGVVVGADILHDVGDPLQSHAGIDGRFR